MSSSFATAPIDPISRAGLAANGLRLDLVDTDDATAFACWLQADMRGFHAPRLSDEAVEEYAERVGYRRTSGVWDASAAHPASPVATVSSWPAELTVPGVATVTAWAISSVTVAPTHRRKGIARALLEGELRTAAALGVPLAMLTVSESTIYGRYGFAPSVMAAGYTVDTRRVAWTGAAASGRLHFVPLEQFRAEAPAMFDRVRLMTPGQIEVWPGIWDSLAGAFGDDKDRGKNTRAVRYDDADGAPQGYVLYRLKEADGDFTAHTLAVEYLMATDAESYAALWRYVLEMDLVSEVRAGLRSADEPLRWQLGDFRAATVTTGDHLWVRILDLPVALESRKYGAPARIAFDVSDPLGYAAGRWILDIAADGSARVTATDQEPQDADASVTLTISELGALYLGGVSADTLVRAGRIVERTQGSAAVVDSAFRANRTPWLSVWF